MRPRIAEGAGRARAHPQARLGSLGTAVRRGRRTRRPRPPPRPAGRARRARGRTLPPRPDPTRSTDAGWSSTGSRSIPVDSQTRSTAAARSRGRRCRWKQPHGSLSAILRRAATLRRVRTRLHRHCADSAGGAQHQRRRSLDLGTVRSLGLLTSTLDEFDRCQDRHFVPDAARGGGGISGDYFGSQVKSDIRRMADRRSSAPPADTANPPYGSKLAQEYMWVLRVIWWFTRLVSIR